MNYAIFVDYENLFAQVPADYNAGDGVLRVIERTMRTQIRTGDRVLIARAYADWETVGGNNSQASLALLGVKPEYVLAHRGKNSADLELSLDVMYFLLTRPDLDTFIILGGDRDYIPIASRIREAGKRVEIVGFMSATSGDLIGLVGERSFFDASRYFSSKSTPQGNGASGSHGLEMSADAQDPTQANLDRTLALILEVSQRVKSEIWLGPFLKNYMNDAFASLNNAGRKALIRTLEEMDVIRIEERPGAWTGGSYSVITINADHPKVAGRLPVEVKTQTPDETETTEEGVKNEDER